MPGSDVDLASYLRRLKVLEEENRNLKQLVADLSLDKQMLRSFRITATCRASRVESPFTEPMRSLAARTSGAR